MEISRRAHVLNSVKEMREDLNIDCPTPPTQMEITTESHLTTSPRYVNYFMFTLERNTRGAIVTALTGQPPPPYCHAPLLRPRLDGSRIELDYRKSLPAVV